VVTDEAPALLDIEGTYREGEREVVRRSTEKR
jgi:hypothetical protein